MAIRPDPSDPLPWIASRQPRPTVMSQAGRIVLAALTLLGILVPNLPRPAHARARHGADAMLEPHTASLLVDYFDTFLRNQDIESFRQSVTARYTEGTLGRLAQSGGVKARRAAVLALGLVGSFESNEAVARGLRDPDPVVRNLAQNALWAIWFRADTPENNARLQQVRDLIGRDRYHEAIGLASSLIERAPGFAEAYNQRAIALFALDRFAESAADCRRVLERNPYHIGALSGLGQCYIRLNRRNDALATFRQALKIQPYSENLRQTVTALELADD